MAIDKKRLDDYIFYINTLLKQEDFYDEYMEAMRKGQNKYTMAQRFQKKKFDLDWVEAIEDCVISLDTIVRNPRKFIVIEEDIVDVSLARNITTESVKHLATHTNLIASVNEQGMVIPSKILNTSKEESFEVYENRFIYTLLLKLHQFISVRFEAVKKAAATSDTFTVKVDSSYDMGPNKVVYKMETILRMPLDEMIKVDPGQLTDVERIARLQSVVNGFMGSSFAKSMVSCALVRPPIVRTNVILKNPDFKKALVLWQFIDSYQQTGFEIKLVDEVADLPDANRDKYANLVYLTNILTESIVRSSTSEPELTEEEQKKKDRVIANEYITKNIDDFVPDDFPELKLSIFETKRIFTRLPEVAEVTAEESRKINRAIDRCLLQYKINRAKQDSEEQLRLERKLMQEEQKAKEEALKAAKLAEKRAEKERKAAEKRFAREEKERKKLEKELALKEQAERAERIRIEEEEALRARLAAEQAEAERRILEENERLRLMLEGEKARIALEKERVREQLTREKQLQFLEPVEAEAMLKLRRKEQQRIRQMRAAQEVALRELITAHYQDMERMQQQAILDMEQIADMCDFDIFDSTPIPEAPVAAAPAVEEKPAAAPSPVDEREETPAEVPTAEEDLDDLDLPEPESVDNFDDLDLANAPTLDDFTHVEINEDLVDEADIGEIDTSLTSRNAEGVIEYAAILQHADEEEEDPTATRSEMTLTAQSFVPNADKKRDDDFDEDLMFSGFDSPIDATAKYAPDYAKAARSAVGGKVARPSKVVTPIRQLDDDWDFDGVETLEQKKSETAAVSTEPTEEQKRAIADKSITGKKVDHTKAVTPSANAPTVYVPKPRNTMSVTASTIDDILGNQNVVGNTDADSRKKKKKFRK